MKTLQRYWSEVPDSEKACFTGKELEIMERAFYLGVNALAAMPPDLFKCWDPALAEASIEAYRLDKLDGIGVKMSLGCQEAFDAGYYTGAAAGLKCMIDAKAETDPVKQKTYLDAISAELKNSVNLLITVPK